MALRFFKLTRVPIKPLSSYRFISTLTEQQRKSKMITMETKINKLEETINKLEETINKLEETIKNLNSTNDIKYSHFNYKTKNRDANELQKIVDEYECSGKIISVILSVGCTLLVIAVLTRGVT